MSARDFEDDEKSDYSTGDLTKVIASTVQLSQVDAIIVAELTDLLCAHNSLLRASFMEQPTILTTLLKIVRDLASQVSEECLANCLHAIAALANKSNEAAMTILAEPCYAGAIHRIATEF